MHTKDKLAQELHKAGLEEMAKRAEKGYYHDFLSELPDASLQLMKDLESAGTPESISLAKRHMKGEFDANLEESEEWMNKEGKNYLAQIVNEISKQRKSHDNQ